MRSPSQYSFSRVPRVSIPRSSFKRDRSLKTAFNAGYLVPIYSDEVYPGDTFNVRLQAFARLATPILPFMDNLYMDFFFFYVPYRLLWEHWNNFLGEQDNPDDSTDYLTPVLGTKYTDDNKKPLVDDIPVESLLDYLGFPTGTFGTVEQQPTRGLEINAFLPRAYNKIWNDHFRDENLQDRVPELKNDGPDYWVAPADEDASKNQVAYRLLKRGKRKDYFTSCLPWPQKGPGAEIRIGSSGSAPVFGDGNPLAIYNNIWLDAQTTKLGVLSASANTSNSPAMQMRAWDADVGEGTTNLPAQVGASSPIGVQTLDMVNEAGFESAGLYADLSKSVFSPVSINDLRMAFQLQRLLEKNARGGTRANELILQHFGVVCPDYRLQRSEFLGGGEIPIQIHQVTQTSSTDSTSPQGNTAAFGVASGRVGFSKSFVEDGGVGGGVYVRSDLTYQQGLHRSWTRRSRWDYYWPTLAHLGEQAVLNKEIFASGDPNSDNAAFGYQERWAELRYGVSQITGKLRTDSSSGLDVWHLAQHFDNLPTLNATFIQDSPPVDRVVAVPSEPQIVYDSLIQCNCVRPLPMYSVPGLIDHF